MTFIKKHVDHIFGLAQIAVFFLLGFQIGGLSKILSVVAFVIVAFRFFMLYRVRCTLECFKTELCDIIVLSVFIVSLIICKTIFDGISLFTNNLFHFGFLVVLFWLSSRTLNSKFGLNGLSNLLAYFVGSFLFICLNCGVSFADFGLKSNVRLFIDCWTGEYISSTIASLYILPLFMVSLSLIAFFAFKKRLVLPLVLLIPVLIGIYLSARLGNRGFFVASAFSIFIMCHIIYFQLDIQKNSKYDWLLYIPLALSLSVLVLSLLTRFNVFGISDSLAKIPLFERFLTGGTDTTRKQIYESFFKVAWKYPFGGTIQSGALENGQYVHNAFLDMYGHAGIICLICFLYFVVRTFISVTFKGIYKEKLLLVYLLVPLFLGILSISFFEPVFNANAYYFASFFGFFSLVARDDPFEFKKKKIQLELVVDGVEEAN